MRIAYISYPAFADCDFPLVRALREEGNEVLYYLIVTPFHCHSTLVDIDRLQEGYDIVPGSVYPELRQYDAYLDSASIRLVNFGGNEKGKVFRLWRKLHRELRKIRPDVIQLTHFFPPHALYYYLTFRSRLFITIHDPVYHAGEFSRRDAFLRKMGASSMRGFVFLSHNDRLTGVFREAYRIPAAKIHYAALAPYDCLQVVPRDPQTHDSDFLFIGRISPYKGIDTLLAAMDILSQKRSGAKLIIAGAGDFWFDISAYANRPDIELIHRFVSTSEMVALMADTRYVVCPYAEGTQSGVIMSALALGRPVIATEVGDFASIIEEGVNGMLVPPSDPAALAAAMDAALAPDRLAHFRQNFDVCDHDPEWRRIARMYEAAYQS
jgi:glycosyltransferase involved in cell wall biosynthesis